MTGDLLYIATFVSSDACLMTRLIQYYHIEYLRCTPLYAVPVATVQLLRRRVLLAEHHSHFSGLFRNTLWTSPSLENKRDFTVDSTMDHIQSYKK
ncbi:hypothetical protein FKM82_002885 [Ascaphus truei]